MKLLVSTQPGQFKHRRGKKSVLIRNSTPIRITRMGICGTDLHACEGTQPYFGYPASWVTNWPEYWRNRTLRQYSGGVIKVTAGLNE